MTERTMDKIVDSWRGESVDSVVQHWGIPDGQFQGRDGRIYEWIQRESATLPGTAQTTTNIIGDTAYSTTTYSGPIQISGVCVRQLSTNPAGVVVAGSWRGNNCCFMAVAGYCATLANPRR